MIHVIGFPTFKLYIYIYITQKMRDEQTAILKEEEEVAQAKKAAAVASLSRVLAVHRAVLRAASILSWTARNAAMIWKTLMMLSASDWVMVGLFLLLHVLSKWICHACLYMSISDHDHPTSADVSPICFTYWYAHEFVNVGCIDSIPSYYTHIYIYIYIAIHCN